jgi:1-deoxyxylulose-5-phosphate synthase
MKSSSAGAERRGRLVVGTAALGLAYGLAGADGSNAAPDEVTAIALLRRAWAEGIACFDTAPAYGEAEARLGRALPAEGAVWTKFDRRLHPGELAPALQTSLAGSLQRLGRDKVEVFHWHNWTRATADEPGFARFWPGLAGDPRFGRLACSTYGVEDALAAVTSGWFAVVQVEANILNRSVLRAIAGPARVRGVTIAVRSVFLQGVLTPKGAQLPADLAGLQQARGQCAALAERLGIPLAQLALRTLLDDRDVGHVLIGVDRPQQLAEALTAADAGPLPDDVSAELASYEPTERALTDPRTWSR